MAILEPLAVFQHPQFLRQINPNIGVTANAIAPACFQESPPIEDAIPQIAFGDRTQTCHRASLGKGDGLFRLHMGGMDQAPTGINISIVQQPGNRPRAISGLDICDFGDLFCNMDMDRSPAKIRCKGGQHRRWHSPQAMGGNTQDRIRR